MPAAWSASTPSLQWHIRPAGTSLSLDVNDRPTAGPFFPDQSEGGHLLDEIAQFSEAVVARVEIRQQLYQMAADTSQVCPATFGRCRINRLIEGGFEPRIAGEIANVVALDFHARAADYNHVDYDEPDTVLIAQLMGKRRATPAPGTSDNPSDMYAIPNRRATADIISKLPGAVLALGDTAYEDGSAQDYRNCYAPTSA